MNFVYSHDRRDGRDTVQYSLLGTVHSATAYNWLTGARRRHVHAVTGSERVGMMGVRCSCCEMPYYSGGARY